LCGFPCREILCNKRKVDTLRVVVDNLNIAPGVILLGCRKKYRQEKG